MTVTRDEIIGIGSLVAMVAFAALCLFLSRGVSRSGDHGVAETGADYGTGAHGDGGGGH